MLLQIKPRSPCVSNKKHSFTKTLFCTSKTFSAFYSLGSALWSGKVIVFPSLLSLFPLPFLREQCRNSGKVCVKPFTFFLDDILQKWDWSCCASQAVFSTRKNTLGRLLRCAWVTVEHTFQSKSGEHVCLTPMRSFEFLSSVVSKVWEEKRKLFHNLVWKLAVADSNGLLWAHSGNRNEDASTATIGVPPWLHSDLPPLETGTSTTTEASFWFPLEPSPRLTEVVGFMNVSMGLVSDESAYKHTVAQGGLVRGASPVFSPAS